MPDSLIAQLPPQELAERLDRGEPLQVLDVRAPDKVDSGHIALGSELDFHAQPNSKLFAMPDVAALQLDAARPSAVTRPIPSSAEWPPGRPSTSPANCRPPLLSLTSSSSIASVRARSVTS